VDAEAQESGEQQRRHGQCQAGHLLPDRSHARGYLRKGEEGEGEAGGEECEVRGRRKGVCVCVRACVSCMLTAPVPPGVCVCVCVCVSCMLTAPVAPATCS
jgi:hypothetical protein